MVGCDYAELVGEDGKKLGCLRHTPYASYGIWLKNEPGDDFIM